MHKIWITVANYKIVAVFIEKMARTIVFMRFAFRKKVLLPYNLK